MTLHYVTLHYIHYITLHCIALHYITLLYITLHYIYTYIPLHCITLHYITLHYIHYITLPYITLHYITYIIHTYIRTYVHTYMYTCRVTSNKIEIGQIWIELFFSNWSIILRGLRYGTRLSVGWKKCLKHTHTHNCFGCHLVAHESMWHFDKQKKYWSILTGTFVSENIVSY